LTQLAPMYLHDESPSAFSSLEGGGPLPQVPPDLRLYEVVWPGAARICALGLSSIDGGFEDELWSDDGHGPARVRLGERDGSVDSKLVGGEGGSCRVLRSDWKRDVTTVASLQGGALTTLAAPFHADLVTSGPDGALWYFDVHGQVVGRATVSGGHFEVRTFPLPSAQAGCDHFDDLTYLVAVSADDAWAVARGACAAGRADALLRTHASKLRSWPAPGSLAPSP
jgi:hypothetical protein